MAKASLVVRDGNDNRNRNSSLTFFFSIWGNPRIPHVSKNMTPHVGEKGIIVRGPGNKHDRFAVVLLEDEKFPPRFATG